MTLFMSDKTEGLAHVLGAPVTLRLSRADVALVIDALLQAEMTLPLLDPRYRSMKSVDRLRARQLALADQLEDLIADERCVQPEHPGGGTCQSRE